MRNAILDNPFKFGTLVDDAYFTDRVNEVAYIQDFLKGRNHLVLIGPRRFGKSSVVARALRLGGRKHMTVNLQQVTSVTDLSAKLLREFLRQHPQERLRNKIKQFRIVPTLSLNPVSGAMEVSLQPGADGATLLEDVLTLMDAAHTDKNRLVVVLDEFQEIRDIAPRLDSQLRAIMQTQRHINYILLGSQESMMTEIFERKKSPFYHFGELMRLGKLPRKDFHQYLSERLALRSPAGSDALADKILDFTQCHPHYSQQLAANVWQAMAGKADPSQVVDAAIGQIVTTHGLDYERLWQNLNRTNKWILQRLASGKPPRDGEHPTSTVYSALRRMQQDGYVIFSDHYEMEDPFFRQWLLREMNA